MPQTAGDHPHGAPRIVIACALSLFVIFGIRLSFSVFFAEFVTTEGWSSEAAAAIFSLNMLFFALTAPLAGLALDRWGPRPVFGVGVLLMAVGLGWSGRAATLNDLLLSYGVIAGCGLGITGLGPVASVVAGWTTRAQRGRAIGIAFAGTGLGSLVFVPLVNWLITQFAWRGAYNVLSLLCIGLLLPLMVIGLKRPPSGHSQPSPESSAKTPWRNLLRQGSFWALMAVGLTALGPVRSLTVHQIAYMESAGVLRDTAAAVVGFGGLLTSGSFVFIGWVSDRFGRAAAFTLGACGLLGAVAMLALLPVAGSLALLPCYALFFALGEGSRSSQATALASDAFQSQGLGFINGLLGGMFGIGAALGPWLVGRLRDESGGYESGLLVIAMMVLASLAAFWHVARKDPHKKSQL